MSLYADFQKLNVGGLITLYELDATRLNGEVYRWHGHMGREDWQYIDSNRVITGDIVRSDIIWQGNVFTPLAIKSSGLEMRGDGKASSPVLNIQNNNQNKKYIKYKYQA